MKTLISLFLSLFLPSISFGYAEMTRHGYVSCTVCHLSPNGGGILTPYGRSLANELLTQNWFGSQKKSTQNSDSEATEIVEKWLKGANARVLFFHRNNEYEDGYVTIPMQFEAYGAYNTEKYALVLGAAVAGQRSGSGGEGGGGFIISNAYGLYRLNDELNVRAGQFLPAYGLNNSLHAIATRAPIGFGYKDQRPGLEFSYLGDKWALFLSQQSEIDSKRGDSASSIQVQYMPTDRSKVAVNYWKEADLRELYGFWFIAPLDEKFYLSMDYNNQKEPKFDTNGTFYYTKFGYEIKQGLHAYLVKDFSQRDLDLDYTQVDRYGLGVQLFPYLHWEVDAVWLKEKNKVSSGVEADYAYIMVHYYL